MINLAHIFIMGGDDDSCEESCYKESLRASWRNDLDRRRIERKQPELFDKYKDMGPGTFVTTGERGHFPWLWE